LIIDINQRDITGNYSTLNTVRFASTKNESVFSDFFFLQIPLSRKCGHSYDRLYPCSSAKRLL